MWFSLPVSSHTTHSARRTKEAAHESAPPQHAVPRRRRCPRGGGGSCAGRRRPLRQVGQGGSPGHQVRPGQPPGPLRLELHRALLRLAGHLLQRRHRPGHRAGGLRAQHLRAGTRRHRQPRRAADRQPGLQPPLRPHPGVPGPPRPPGPHLPPPRRPHPADGCRARPLRRRQPPDRPATGRLRGRGVRQRGRRRQPAHRRRVGAVRRREAGELGAAVAQPVRVRPRPRGAAGEAGHTGRRPQHDLRGHPGGRGGEEVAGIRRELQQSVRADPAGPVHAQVRPHPLRAQQVPLRPPARALQLRYREDVSLERRLYVNRRDGCRNSIRPRLIQAGIFP